MNILTLLISLLMWWYYCIVEARDDASDYIRKKQSRGDTVFSIINKTLSPNFFLTWSLRAIIYALVVALKIYGVWFAALYIDFNNLQKVTLIILSFVTPLLSFPFFYYGSLCYRIREHQEKLLVQGKNLNQELITPDPLAPKGWVDNLRFNGKYVLSFPLRLYLFLIAVIFAFLQMFISFI
jgi:hypothetical protein